MTDHTQQARAASIPDAAIEAAAEAAGGNRSWNRRADYIIKSGGGSIAEPGTVSMEEEVALTRWLQKQTQEPPVEGQRNE